MVLGTLSTETPQTEAPPAQGDRLRGASAAPGLFASGAVPLSLRYKAQPSGMFFLEPNWKVYALSSHSFVWEERTMPVTVSSRRPKLRNKTVTVNGEHQRLRRTHRDEI